MEALLKITESNGKSVVSARELYDFLEISERFNNWMERMFQYGFVEYEDFTSVKSFTVVNNGAKREVDDFALTIDCAKEISMLQRSEKGKQARQYFIECEKQLLSNISLRLPSAKELALMVVKAEEEKEQLMLQLKEIEPKAIFADSVCASRTSILVGELAKILKQNGIDLGQNRLFEWLRDRGYLIMRKGSDYNMPTQKSMEKKLFEIKETSITHSNGTITISKTAKVTGIGQVYFINLFLKHKTG